MAESSGSLATVINMSLPLLQKSEVERLVEKMRAGDQAAFDRLVQSNLRLVLDLARKHARPGVSLEDRFQYGVLGLIRAIVKFDPQRGRLSTYATWWIRREITRNVGYETPVNGMRLPAHVQSSLNSLIMWVETERQRGNNPTVDAKLIQSQFRVAPAMAHHLADLYQNPTTLSLDYPITGAKGSVRDAFGELIGVPEETTARLIVRELVSQALEKLSSRQRQVLALHYYESMSVEEISRTFGVTDQRIRQILAAAKKRLHQALSTTLAL